MNSNSRIIRIARNCAVTCVQICEQSSQWAVYWNDEQKVPYGVNGNQWVGFDNADSLKLKVQDISEYL
jgi:hypothetical protein